MVFASLSGSLSLPGGGIGWLRQSLCDPLFGGRIFSCFAPCVELRSSSLICKSGLSVAAPHGMGGGIGWLRQSLCDPPVGGPIFRCYAPYVELRSSSLICKSGSSVAAPHGMGGGIRTPDPRIRNPMLYPTELRPRVFLKVLIR